mmetsp:Transcript_1524/g.3259  ORF Transcript_1524/g.3259 Transcript_1524/m.3259 type:complete len:310 (-) Transcript_1524:84-1013(-)
MFKDPWTRFSLSARVWRIIRCVSVNFADLAIRRGRVHQGGIGHVLRADFVDRAVVLAQLLDQGGLRLPRRREGTGRAGVSQIVHFHGLVIVDGTVGHAVWRCGGVVHELEVSAESLLQFRLLPRDLQIVLLAQELQLRRLHLIKLVFLRHIFLRRRLAALAVLQQCRIRFLLLLQRRVPLPIRLHGLVGHIRPRSLEHPHRLHALLRLGIRGPPEQERRELDRTRQIHRQSVRSYLTGSPSFERRDVFHPILSRLHLDVGEVVGGDEYAASFEIGEQRSERTHVHVVILHEIISVDPRHVSELLLEMLV